MEKERYRRISELFDRVRDLPADERKRALASADPDLVTEVEALLAYDEPEHSGMLDHAEVGLLGRELLSDLHPTNREATPHVIGDFEIVRELGSGGMGVVYAARHVQHGEDVALKVIRPGLESERLLKRFHRESEVLRLLDHPGIAKFYGAGTASPRYRDGREEPPRPFLAMELVDGPWITEHARTENLSFDERLELIARVCDALHHAHENGVIHRDLKPGNILVVRGTDRIGQPVAVDFGVAHATHHELATMTRTATGVMLGTLAYMSPEQLDDVERSVDRRSDVYSVGVLLFELLLGRLPFDFAGRSIPHVARLIQEEEPAKLGSYHERFRGRIETIVAKALEKRPRDRYRTAAAMAFDLRRHLAGRRIAARPPSTWRRVQRFTRRNKTLVAAAIATILSLSAGLALAVHYAMRETRSRHEAEAYAERADVNARRADLNAYRAILTSIGASETISPSARATQLELTRPALRGWEWQHLVASGDASVDTLTLASRLRGTTRMAFDVSDEIVWLATADSSRGQGTLRQWNLDTRTLGVADQWSDAFDVRLTPDSNVLHIQGRNTARVIDLEGRHRFAKVDVVGNAKSFPTYERTQLLFLGEEELRRIDLTSGESEVLLKQRMRFGKTVWLDASAKWAALHDGPMIRLLSLEDPTIQRSFRVPYPGLSGVLITRDGERVIGNLVSQSYVRQWMWNGTEMVPGPVLGPHAGGVRGLAIGPDDQHVAVGSGQGLIYVWNVTTGVRERVLAGHEQAVRALAFAKSGDVLASMSPDGVLKRWSLAPDPRTIHHRRNVYTGRFLRTNGTILTSSTFHPMTLVDARSSRPVAKLGSMRTDTRVVDEHPTRPWIAFGTSDPETRRSTILLVDVRTGETLAEVHQAEKRGDWSVAFSPDGTRLAAMCPVEGTFVWDTTTWKQIAHRPADPGHSGGTRPILAWCSDDRLAVLGVDPTIVMLEGDSLTEIAVLEGHEAHLSDIATDRDRHRFATASMDGTIRIWDSTTLENKAVLRGHTGGATSVTFAPDGQRIVSGGTDQTVRLWSLKHDVEMCLLTAHDQTVDDVCFNADGTVLLSSSSDGTAKLWELTPLSTRLSEGRLWDELVERLEPQVRGWLDEHGKRGAAERIEAMTSFDERERQVALQILLRAGVSR